MSDQILMLYIVSPIIGLIIYIILRLFGLTKW